MKKIDEKLINFAILSQQDCKIEGIVYYFDRLKTIDFFRKNKIKILQEFNFLNAFVVCLTSKSMFLTASQNFIKFISSVSSVTALMDVSKKILNTYNIKLTGKDVTIAFIDTGINCHIDYTLGKNRMIKFCDFVNKYDYIYDDNGHGTFVTGVACGSGLLSHGRYSGIAKNSSIISLKALNGKGEANALTILEAMQWVYDNYQKYNIKIVCMSFGSEPLGNKDPIMKGAEKLWDEGIVVVCAGGNSGPELQTIKSPGVSRRIITVGGLDDKRTPEGEYDEKLFDIADFSSRGPAFGKVKPDIIAPSVNITSCSHLGGYKQMSGTSVATPMIAGICALLFEKYPNATPEQIKKYLINYAKPLHKSKYAEGYGCARLI